MSEDYEGKSKDEIPSKEDLLRRLGAKATGLTEEDIDVANIRKQLSGDPLVMFDSDPGDPVVSLDADEGDPPDILKMLPA